LKKNTNQLVKKSWRTNLLKLAILGRDAKYTNDGRSVEITVRIEGNKANGKIDISKAHKRNRMGIQKITVRINTQNRKCN
jgi:hypothetical protein